MKNGGRRNATRAFVLFTIAMAAVMTFPIFVLGILAGRGRSFYSVPEYGVADRGQGLFVGVSLLVRQSDETRARSAAFVET